MKALLLVLLISVNAHSEPTNCETIGGISEAIMKSRQEGARLSEMLASTKDDVLKNITVYAYETPRYMTKAIRERTIIEFGNSMTLACIKSRLEQEQTE